MVMGLAVTFFLHIYRASWYYQSFFYSPTDAQVIVLKTILNLH
jgi:hypothetical protein